MIWPILFSIGLAQGVFLISILSCRKRENRLAKRFLTLLLFLFVLSNYDDLLLATQWYTVVPKSFGTSLAAYFAIGPLFYLYVQSITNPQFAWCKQKWFHFVPFIVGFLFYLPILFMPASQKISMLDSFLAGKFSMQFFDMAIASIKTIHFGSYVYLAFCQTIKVREMDNNSNFLIPFQLRVKWLNTLILLLFLIFLAVAGVSIFNILNKTFVSNVNFGFTVLTCSIMYFIAYKLMLQPALVTPGFAEKYATLHRQKSETEGLLLELNRYLDSGRIFNDPDLKLRSLAADLGVTPHHLSMIINGRFGQSFSDFINQQRVEEFIRRLNNPQYAHYSLYGLALEVGFNSKSAFNAAFKKITGKTPSDFRK